MSDNEKRAHDLALVAAAISANRDFEIESDGHDSEERRFRFANYLRDEYEYFFNLYLPANK